ncbi:MAG: SDR family oxidoreductase [Treponema sp.]|jgi:NAD(P)-dependent dehydrogenase (short-subunit alcohol dehydrogenase family)|nr:SDR family oxidoreductase [Treponema sp.]
MKIDLTGKTAVVTGGSSGIGFAAVRALGLCGAKVAFCGTNEKRLADACDVLGKENICVYGEACDVADSAALFNFADNAEKNLGEIGVWVSNAAVYPQYLLVETPEDVWYRTLDVNMKSVYLGGRIARRKMRNGGVLINAASFAGIMPSVGSGLYAASKAAVSSMTKVLAAELAPLCIRVCAYTPGVIDTGITHPLIEANGEAMKNSIAMRRFGRCEEVGNCIAFLASDYASYVSGVTLEISGGKFCVQNPADAWSHFETAS